MTSNDIGESQKAAVRRMAMEMLADAPDGVRFGEIVERASLALPDASVNALRGALVTFTNDLPDEIENVARGIYRHVRFAEDAGEEAEPPEDEAAVRLYERDVYQPFADFLTDRLQECTKAISLGGNVFSGKWGTPDVIGIREHRRGALVPFPTEIVSAEVKIARDGRALIVAFGQACAYRAFSHKVYLVIPNDSQAADVERLDVLSRIFGLGLIVFDASTAGSFEIRVRAVKHEPDGFYLNECVNKIKDRLFA